MKINKKLIKELVENLEEFKLTELEYSESDIKIKVSRQIQTSQNISAPVGTEKNDKKVENKLSQLSKEIDTVKNTRTKAMSRELNKVDNILNSNSIEESD